MRLQDEDDQRAREDSAGLLLTLTNDKMNHAMAGPICIPALIAGCSDPSHVVQERCAGSLWNLSDYKENALLIARYGGVQALTRLLQHGGDFAKEEACGALWTLVDDETNTSLVVLSGALGPLVKMLDLDRTSSFMQENASGCLWNLSASAGARKLLMDDHDIIPSLVRLLREGSIISKENVFGILAHLFIDSEKAKKDMIGRKGLQRIVQAIMFAPSIACKENATMALMEIARKDPVVQFQLAQEGAITALLKLLVHGGEMSIKIKAAEAIKILGELPANKKQLSELGTVPEVLRMLEQAKRTREERLLLTTSVSTLDKTAADSVTAFIIPDPNFHLDDIGSFKRYVHFDSAVLDSGLEMMIAKRMQQDEEELAVSSTTHDSPDLIGEGVLNPLEPECATTGLDDENRPSISTTASV